MGEKEKEKEKSSGGKIKKPEVKPEPTKNILTEATTQPERWENFSDEWNPKEGITIDSDDNI